METVKLKGLESLGWRADHCKLHGVTSKRNSLQSGRTPSMMILTGSITFEIKKGCGVRFGWKAEQVAVKNESAGKFSFSVDMSGQTETQGLIFEDEAGARLPSEFHRAVIHRLARDTVTNWSNTVSHYLKSLR